MTNPKRGEVWLVDFDQIKPNKLGKTRPALVIQDDSIDIGTLIAIPFSTNIVPDSEPLRINYSLKFLDKNLDLAIPQMRSLSTGRFHKKLGSLSATELTKISQYIGLVLCLK